MLNQKNLVFLLLASAYKPEIVAAQATTNAKVLRDEWKRLEVIGSGAAAVRRTVSQFRLLLGAFEEYRSIPSSSKETVSEESTTTSKTTVAESHANVSLPIAVSLAVRVDLILVMPRNF